MFKALNHENHHGEKCKQRFAQTPQFWVFLETSSETTWRYGRQGLRLAAKEVQHHCFPYEMGFATDTGWTGRPNGVMLGCSCQRVHALGFTEPGGPESPRLVLRCTRGSFQGKGGQPISDRPGDTPFPALAHLECSFPSIHSKEERVFKTPLLSYHSDSAQKLEKSCHYFYRFSESKNDLATDSDGPPPALLAQCPKHEIQHRRVAAFN